MAENNYRMTLNEAQKQQQMIGAHRNYGNTRASDIGDWFKSTFVDPSPKGIYAKGNSHIDNVAGNQFMNMQPNKGFTPLDPNQGVARVHPSQIAATQNLRAQFNNTQGTNLTLANPNPGVPADFFGQGSPLNNPATAPNVNVLDTSGGMQVNPMDIMGSGRVVSNTNVMQDLSGMGNNIPQVPAQLQDYTPNIDLSVNSSQIGDFISQNSMNPDIAMGVAPQEMTQTEMFNTNQARLKDEFAQNQEMSGMDMFNIGQGVVGLGMGMYQMNKQNGFMEDKIDLMREKVAMQRENHNITNARRGYA